MERLTYEKRRSRWNEGRYPTKYTSQHTFQEVVARLAAYEDTGLEPEEVLTGKELAEVACAVNLLKEYQDIGPVNRFRELAQAEKDGRLVVLNPVAKEGVEKPPCFYNDMGQSFCLGFARGEYDDEPIDRCKECWYCESTREEAEAALKKREEADNEH